MPIVKESVVAYAHYKNDRWQFVQVKNVVQLGIIQINGLWVFPVPGNFEFLFFFYCNDKSHFEHKVVLYI